MARKQQGTSKTGKQRFQHQPKGGGGGKRSRKHKGKHKPDPRRQPPQNNKNA